MAERSALPRRVGGIVYGATRVDESCRLL
ncbi:MAG: hypothetical protein V7643_17, partial [Mycobacterium sp.]